MRFMHENADGRAVIVTAAPKADIEAMLGPMTEENYMAHVIGKSLPPGVKEVIVLADDWTPPQSRHFRNAWVIRDGQVTVDMPRARDIQRDHIRAERAPRFAGLDVEAMRAIEAKDEARIDAVAAAKQKLRDAPAHPAIETAETPEALAAITLASVTA